MNYFKCGDRVQLKTKMAGQFGFDFSKESGIVVGYATLQSGVPCVILSMDSTDSNGIRHDRLVVSMDAVEVLS
jgi:hypothetical protein